MTSAEPGLLRTGLRYLPVGLALLAVQLDYFSLNLAIPTIAKDLAVTATDLQWLMSGYVLSLSIMFIPAGKIGDTIGRKRTILIGAVVFGAMSLACALSRDAGLLIAFRVLQGVGAGLMMPNAFALVGATTAPSLRPRAIGILLTIAGIGTAFGPVLGGIFAATIGWQWVFLVNVPICVLALAASRPVPEYFVGERRGSLRTVDWTGFALVVLGTGLFCVGLDDVTEHGWASPLTWGLLVLGVAGLVGFWLWIQRAKSPLVGPRLLRNAPFLLLALSGGVLNAMINVLIFCATLQLQDIEGFGPEVAGLMFLGVAVGGALSGPAAGWFGSRYPARRVLTIALLIEAAAMAAVAFSASWLPGYIAALAVGGFCSGLGYNLAQVAGQQMLPAAEGGEGAGVLSMLMGSAGGIGVVLAGVLIESMAGDTATTPSITWTIVVFAAITLAVWVLSLATGRGSRGAAASPATARR